MTALSFDAAATLDRIPYLRTLAASDRSALAAVCEVRRIAKGARVFSEGDPPAGVFLILAGRIRLVRSSPDGREQVLHEEGPGVTLAEVPAFDGEGYVASAIAVEDSVVFLVPRQPLLRTLERNPGNAAEVIRVLARRVRRFAALVEDLSLRPVTERLAGFLLRGLEQAGGGAIVLPATRDQLAAHIGTVREQASRALSHLKRIGIIELKGRTVRVLDRERLGRLGGM